MYLYGRLESTVENVDIVGDVLTFRIHFVHFSISLQLHF